MPACLLVVTQSSHQDCIRARQNRTTQRQKAPRAVVIVTGQRPYAWYIDILPALKGEDSYGAQAAFAWFASVGSCCWRHYRAAHFTGEPGVSRP